MDPLSEESTPTMTFVLRFWREWSGPESRWRGRVEHVESGQSVSFLEIEGLLRFLEQFGICAGADQAVHKTGEQGGAQCSS